MTVSIPAGAGPDTGSPGSPAASAPPAGAAAFAKVACLISADDDAAFSAAVRPLLAELAERVVQLADGADLLAAARRERAAAIVVDLDMPEVDGYACVRRLAEAPDLADVPVVVVTAFPPQQVDRARLGHARAVLGKDALDAPGLARALGVAPAGPGPA